MNINDLNDILEGYIELNRVIENLRYVRDNVDKNKYFNITLQPVCRSNSVLVSIQDEYSGRFFSITIEKDMESHRTYNEICVIVIDEWVNVLEADCKIIELDFRKAILHIKDYSMQHYRLSQLKHCKNNKQRIEEFESIISMI